MEPINKKDFDADFKVALREFLKINTHPIEEGDPERFDEEFSKHLSEQEITNFVMDWDNQPITKRITYLGHMQRCSRCALDFRQKIS